MNGTQMTRLLPELQPVGWLSIAMAACALTVYAFKFIRAMVRITNRAGEFFDDWKGEAERPGFPARPGIPERIARLEAQAALIQAQVHPNGGMSLRDQTNRIEKALDDHIAASNGGHG